MPKKRRCRMNTIKETSPVDDKPPLSTAPPPATRRRKVNRASPVPKRRYTSPHVIRRSKTFDSETETRQKEDDKNKMLGESDREMETTGIKSEENDVSCKCVRKRSVSNREMTLKSELNDKIKKERVEGYIAKRRNTVVPSKEGISSYCPCRSHRGALKHCHCANRRQLKSPNISESELMEKETKLVVLEFLRSLSPDHLTARKRSSVSSRNSNSSVIEPENEIEFHVKEECIEEREEEMYTPKERMKDSVTEKSTTKYNTVTIGEQQHKELMEMLARQSSDLSSTRNRIGRSRSDISSEKYNDTRDRLEKLEMPVRNWIKTNSTLPRKLKRDIKFFNKKKLRSPPSPVEPASKIPPPSEYHDKKKTFADRRNKSNLSLKISKESLPSAVIPAPRVTDPDLFTPESFAVNRLEMISERIMDDFPGLVQNTVLEMLGIFESSDSSSYDEFSEVVKPVYNLKVPKFSGTVWSRIALVLYTVRETVMLGNLNDRQLELIVEHSTKFFTENAKESVEEEGGWESALGDEIFNSTGLCFDEIDVSSGDEIDEDCPKHGHHANRKTSCEKKDVCEGGEENSVKEHLKEKLNDWMPYGIAALTVALGLSYSYMKT